MSCGDTYYVHTPQLLYFLPPPHIAPLAPQATTGRATWRMSNAGRSRIGCLHCQLICLPSVNSHLKNKTEKECKRERGEEEEVEEWSRGGQGGGRACLRCCNYANSPYTVKRLANKDFSQKTAIAAQQQQRQQRAACGMWQAASGKRHSKVNYKQKCCLQHENQSGNRNSSN